MAGVWMSRVGFATSFRFNVFDHAREKGKNALSEIIHFYPVRARSALATHLYMRGVLKFVIIHWKRKATRTYLSQICILKYARYFFIYARIRIYSISYSLEQQRSRKETTRPTNFKNIPKILTGSYIRICCRFLTERKYPKKILQTINLRHTRYSVEFWLI